LSSRVDVSAALSSRERRHAYVDSGEGRRERIAALEGTDVSENHPNDASEVEETNAPEHETEGLPSGAVAITAMLAVVILLLWFGIYAIDLVRS
jgi:hypothetical protein